MSLIVTRFILSLSCMIVVSMGSCYGFDSRALDALMANNQCERCNFSQADLRGQSLKGAKLAHSDLSDSHLEGSNLAGADLTGVNLEGAQLEGTNLRGAKLIGAKLTGVDLTSVRLAGADLREADLTHLDIDLDLEFVELIGVNLEGARFKNGVRCGSFPKIGGWGCSAVIE